MMAEEDFGADCRNSCSISFSLTVASHTQSTNSIPCQTVCLTAIAVGNEVEGWLLIGWFKDDFQTSATYHIFNFMLWATLNLIPRFLSSSRSLVRRPSCRTLVSRRDEAWGTHEHPSDPHTCWMMKGRERKRMDILLGIYWKTDAAGHEPSTRIPLLAATV